MSHVRIKKWLQPVLCSLALAGSASLGYAQGAGDYIVNQFDDGTTGGWSGNYGNAPYTIEFDGNEDHGPGASPGALKVTINFNPCILPPDPVQIQRDWEKVMTQTLDLTKYTKLHFSVKVDPSSSHLSDWGGGALGGLRPHIRNSSWGGDSNLGANPDNVWVGADAYGAWKDYSYPIDQTLNNLAVRQAMGVWGFDMWSGWGSCAAPIGHTNTVIFWMDNIWFELNPDTGPPVPPTASFRKAGPSGVEITMDDNGSQWQRDAIASPATPGNCFWNGYGSTPVTYSFTIADFPDPAAHAGFEAHMYIVNGDTTGAGDQTYGGCDWNAADIAIVSIQAGGGGYDAQFQMKTNRPNNNPLNDVTNIPAVLHTTSILGTWSLSFSYNTNVTLSGPGGFSTNFFIGEDAVVNNFSPAASFLQFGFHKNDGANDGHNNGISGTYSRIQKTGGDFVFDDTFNGATYTNNYAWRKTSASAVQHVAPGTALFAEWTVPADQFYLQKASAITGPWSNGGATSTYQSGGKIHAVLPASAVPAGNAGFFRVIKRPFTKLQVLMPGETAAPETVSGKTGTPDPQASGTAFNVTVNAVDSEWHLVSSDAFNRIPSTDTIHITSSDGSAALPADAALANGTGTFSVTFNASGSFTVTATDVTNGTRTPNTGSPAAVP